MRYDINSRIRKYSEIADTVKTKGYVTNISTDSNRVDGIGIQKTGSGNLSLFLCIRRRGWFLHVPTASSRQSAVYSIKNKSDVLPALVAIEAEAQLQPEEVVSQRLSEVALESLSFSVWTKEETIERESEWARFGWMAISESELSEIATRYESVFFSTGNLVLPHPSRSWRIKIRGLVEIDANENAETELTMHLLKCLRNAVSIGKYILVLDWLHPSYKWDVHSNIRNAYRDEWAVPPFSCNVDVVFLSPDWEFGIFVLRDGSFHVYGEPFLSDFVTNLPLVGKAFGFYD